MTDLLDQVQIGFDKLSVDDKYKKQALENIKNWLTKEEFKDYLPQIRHLIEKGYWDYLLDSFYQVILFGTGGRRGEVGIGPNRINPWTIKSSAQGHSQYLIKNYGEDAKKKGVVLAFDTRQFFGNKYLDSNLDNPVKEITSKDFAIAASTVYAANGIKVFIFNDIRTTPELSFAIRHLEAIGGDMFSASHNPPDHNGKKVYDQFGGQLIPPDDEILVLEVTQNVSKIEDLDYQQSISQGLIQIIGQDVDEAYIKAAAQTSLSNERNIKIAYTPMHGSGQTSVLKTLQYLGFSVSQDPATSNPSGKFENVTFNIPNPEVEQSFDSPLKHAQEIGADIILNSDPDADRIGIMVKHKGSWMFLNGNEIGSILTDYVIQKKKNSLKGEGVIIKTIVTTDLIKEICDRSGVRLIGDLLVGFKYIGDEINKLEESGNIDNFLFGCEESHGYIAGNYARDKDATIAAIWLAELAAELKKENKTLVDYLFNLYAKYGYFRNYLTEIRLPGAEGKSKIDQIQDSLRKNKPQQFDRFKVNEIADYQNQMPIVSETDLLSKNVLVFHFQPIEDTISIKVTVRPSGTEPKMKMYFEIGSNPFNLNNILQVKDNIENHLKELEKIVMKHCYKIIGVDFPDRGFLLFWQLPLDIKLKYFEIEPQIIELKNIENTSLRQQKLDELLKFLGSNPLEKVDKAFQAQYSNSIKIYLNL